MHCIVNSILEDKPFKNSGYWTHKKGHKFNRNVSCTTGFLEHLGFCSQKGNSDLTG